MADTVRLVEYFYITAPNKPGEGARALNTLKEAGGLLRGQRLQRLNQALIALAVFTGEARQVRALSGGR